MRLTIGLLLALTACSGQHKTVKGFSTEDAYQQKQKHFIDTHVKILQKGGRMPTDFVDGYMVLGIYGWRADNGLSETGPTASLGLLQASGGAFGAYTFYQAAFDQAKRSWWIDGVMKAGSDLLVAVNRNAEFKRVVRSESWDSEGGHKIDQGPPMNSAVGYHVGYMYHGPKDAVVVEVIDGRTLRLNKSSPGDVLQFDLAILPPDYVDMCDCRMPSQ